MKAKVLSFAVFFCVFTHYYSQEREAKIDTVVVFDSQLTRQKDFHPLLKISVEDIQKNATNLSEVLRFQTPIYIKENGRGASSSPSFRGTTAQQTAFLWNGISINSAFLGQGDINNIGFLLADELAVKSGGGSVVYGSGAIGGSIHLNNELRFNQGFHGEWLSQVASFGTFQNRIKSTYSNPKFSFQLSGQHSISQNDYSVEEQDYLNLNGKYSNGSVNLSMAYKLNVHHKISWISELYNGTQNFPIFVASQNHSQYKTHNFKSLGIWEFKQKNLNNHFRLAFTEDEFQYFQKENQEQSSGGTARNFIVKNDFNFQILPQLRLNFLSEFQQNNAVGYLTGIDVVKRMVGSGALLMNYHLFSHVQLEAGVKKDAVQGISSPWLYSFAGKWTVVPQLNTALSFSKNFRYPSFNDLYFQPGGNMELLPETSHQWEWKTQWQSRNFNISITPFVMQIKDMIRWLPTSDGYWKAVNTNRVESFGLEGAFMLQHAWGEHLLKASLGYAYTQSKNKETEMQLMYVPFHKANGMVEYQYQKVKLYVQALWNGKTYTDSMQKESEAIHPYTIINIGTEWPWWKNIIFGAKMNNVGNTVYATTAYYYMPKRNYTITMKINF